MSRVNGGHDFAYGRNRTCERCWMSSSEYFNNGRECDNAVTSDDKLRAWIAGTAPYGWDGIGPAIVQAQAELDAAARPDACPHCLSVFRDALSYHVKHCEMRPRVAKLECA